MNSRFWYIPKLRERCAPLALACPAPLEGCSVEALPLSGGARVQRLHIGPQGLEGGEP